MVSKANSGRFIVLLSLLISLIALGAAVLALLKVYQSERLATKAKEVVSEARGAISKIEIDLSLQEIKKTISELPQNLAEKKDEVVIANLQKAKERLDSFRQEAAPKYKEKMNQLVEATDKAIEAVKNKAKDAGETIESLIKSIDSFLAGEKEEEVEQPDSH